MKTHLVIAASAAFMLAPKAVIADENNYQFQSPRIVGSLSDSGAVQFGVNNDVNGSQHGTGNVLSFLQGVRDTDADNLIPTINEIGRYGLAAESDHGAPVDHAALAKADNLVSRLNDWIAAGASSDGSSADVEQDGDSNATVFFQMGDSLVTNITQIGNDN